MPQPREPVELLVGDRVQGPDLALVPPRQLVQPDVGALRDQDEPWHPRRVAREPLGLRVEAREAGSLATATEGASAPVTAAAEPEVQAALLLGDDVDREEHPGQQVVERVAQEVAPVVADIPELARERGRVGARGRAQQLHQRLAVASDRRQRRLVLLHGRDHGVAAGGRERCVVHEGAERAGRRVLVGDPDEQQLLEPRRRRPVLDVGKLAPHRVEDARRRLRPEGLLHGHRGLRHRGRRHELGGLRNDQVEDLVEQLERRELAGLGAGFAGLASGVDGGGDLPRGGDVGREA